MKNQEREIKRFSPNGKIDVLQKDLVTMDEIKEIAEHIASSISVLGNKDGLILRVNKDKSYSINAFDSRGMEGAILVDSLYEGAPTRISVEKIEKYLKEILI